MTIRKLWLIVVLIVAVFSIGINTLVLSSLTDRYFGDYLDDTYEKHIQEIIEYSLGMLLEENRSYRQMAIELETHLDDPIIGIKLYNTEDELLVEVENTEDSYEEFAHMKANNRRMGEMMSNMQNSMSNETDQYSIIYEKKEIGILNITRRSTTENSFIAMMFKGKLYINSLIGFLIALVLSVILAVFVSRKMSKALIETADMAKAIQLGEKVKELQTPIYEIATIRDSLSDLDTKLRLKQRSRKVLIDELIHQTRTPLTILKSHLEGIEDGVVEADENEIGICLNQITNITGIITNISGMIDASSEQKEVVMETFEFSQLMNQITLGLEGQFKKKKIKLEVKSIENVKVTTDKFLLSQAIYNVMTNAYKYTKEYGLVSIDWKLKDEEIILIIEDNGIGIAKEEQNKIFQAYYRGQQNIEESGEGIGLFIASENLKQLGGTIGVESKIGNGSKFFLHFKKSLT